MALYVLQWHPAPTCLLTTPRTPLSHATAPLPRRRRSHERPCAAHAPLHNPGKRTRRRECLTVACSHVAEFNHYKHTLAVLEPETGMPTERINRPFLAQVPPPAAWNAPTLHSKAPSGNFPRFPLHSSSPVAQRHGGSSAVNPQPWSLNPAGAGVAGGLSVEATAAALLDHCAPHS